MSDTRPTGAGAPNQRNIIHSGVIHDTSVDERYGNGLTNQAKTSFLCGVMRYPEAAFDLELPLPIEDWIVSDDNSLVCAGLYLSDLRTQFYAKRRASGVDEDGALWRKEGEAEFWQLAFNKMVHRRMNGTVITDPRVLH